MFSTVSGVNDHYIVWTTQVITQRLRARVRPVGVGAGQEVIEKFAPHIQLHFSETALMRELESQHAAAVPESKQSVLIDVVTGPDERDNTEDLGVGCIRTHKRLPTRIGPSCVDSKRRNRSRCAGFASGS